MSIKHLEQRIREWDLELQQIEQLFDEKKKRTEQILKRKNESMTKLKQKCQSKSEDHEMNKLLSGMMRDYEKLYQKAVDQDKLFFENISNHEQNFFLMIMEWLQPMMKELIALMNQQDFHGQSCKKPNDIINTNKHKEYGDISKTTSEKSQCSFLDQCQSQIPAHQNIKCEIDYERSQSPYSVAISPYTISKLKQRPPLPKQKIQVTKYTESYNDTDYKNGNRNDKTFCDYNENQGRITSSGFLKFPVQLQSEKCKNQNKAKEETYNKTQIKRNSEFRHESLSKEQEKLFLLTSDVSGTKSKSITSQCVPAKSNADKKIGDQNRPMTPPLKTIADQTAKAALIRTLITERINSCSPVSFNN